MHTLELLGAVTNPILYTHRRRSLFLYLSLSLFTFVFSDDIEKAAVNKKRGLFDICQKSARLINNSIDTYVLIVSYKQWMYSTY